MHAHLRDVCFRAFSPNESNCATFDLFPLCVLWSERTERTFPGNERKYLGTKVNTCLGGQTRTFLIQGSIKSHKERKSNQKCVEQKKVLKIQVYAGMQWDWSNMAPGQKFVPQSASQSAQVWKSLGPTFQPTVIPQSHHFRTYLVGISCMFIMLWNSHAENLLVLQSFLTGEHHSRTSSFAILTSAGNHHCFPRRFWYGDPSFFQCSLLHLPAQDVTNSPGPQQRAKRSTKPNTSYKHHPHTHTYIYT